MTQDLVSIANELFQGLRFFGRREPYGRGIGHALAVVFHNQLGLIVDELKPDDPVAVYHVRVPDYKPRRPQLTAHISDVVENVDPSETTMVPTRPATPFYREPLATISDPATAIAHDSKQPAATIVALLQRYGVGPPPGAGQLVDKVSTILR